jgi:hypothetical protein
MSDSNFQGWVLVVIFMMFIIWGIYMSRPATIDFVPEPIPGPYPTASEPLPFYPNNSGKE